MPQLPQFFSVEVTATADTPFKVVQNDKWLYFFDIFVLDNSALIGDNGVQKAPISANDVYYTLKPSNLNDIFFANATAGSNTRIVILGLEMSDSDLKKMAEGKYAVL